MTKILVEQDKILERIMEKMGKFVIKQTKTGYTFCLKAGNEEVIAIGGEVFNTLASCKNSIESVIKNAQIANVEDQTVEGYQVERHPKFEIYLDKKGKYRFRLKARNGKPIAASEGYTSKSGCKNGIDSIRRNIAASKIVD